MIEKLIKYAKSNPLVRKFQTNFPNTFRVLISKPSAAIRFKNEATFLKSQLKSKTESPSILLFTTHKCASTYTSKILKRIAESKGYTNIDVEAYLSLNDYAPADFFKLKENIKKIDQNKGFLIGPLRYFVGIEKLSQYKIVLVLRDPRDVLTSYYFSNKYSHIPINKKFILEREKYKDHTIDEFVIDFMPEIKRRYQEFVSYVYNLKNCINLPYEYLVGDFNNWLNDLMTFTELEDDLIKKDLLAESKFTVSKENVNNQIRNITPGDYKSKLAPETIEFLNEELAEILQALNYSFD